MFGLGGMDPKKMAGLMKQLGIKTEQVDASRVIIEKNDGKKIVIDEPSVQKMAVQGNTSWQITGEGKEESARISEEDIQLIMKQTGLPREKAKKALEDVRGDLAEAILKLGG